jgi:hypothetical protein
MPTKHAAHKAAPKEVHRNLHLVSPLMHGADVKALQSALKKEMAAHKIDWLPMAVDGKFGPQTVHAARFLSWVIGLGAGHRKPIQERHTVTEATQRLLRDLSKRSRTDVLRAKKRSKRLAKIRKAQDEGAAAAVAYARSFIGTTENPAGSNTGPLVHNDKGQPGGVSFWQQHWGLDGAYWCLSFASYCAAAPGGAKIGGNVSYSVAIEGYARMHENGWIEIPDSEARAGDFRIWKFDGPSQPSDHGEIVDDPAEDVGGNTSSDTGSQSDGGGVFPKGVPGDARPLSSLSMTVRPLYS